MEHRSHFGGLDIEIKNDRDGFTFHIKGDPNHQQARSEIFSLFDQLRQEARRSGVHPVEILGHAIKRKIQVYQPKDRPENS